ncbi:hypothetical protein BG000_007777 [Podila horticola]|nr:hypothetical protein BG000_007777 [Podila horticola]
MSQEPTTRNAEAITQKQSLEVVKDAVRSVVSTILYARGIFTEKAYKDHQGTSFVLKRLVCGMDFDADLLLEGHERGVLEALTKGYLRQLILSVSLTLGGTAGRSNGKTYNETFTLGFSYQHGYPSLKLESSPQQDPIQVHSSRDKTLTLAPPTCSQVKGSISAMLDCLVEYLQPFQFKDDSTKDSMVFLENLNGRQRRILRLIASKLSLYHSSEGEGALCRLVITKTQSLLGEQLTEGASSSLIFEEHGGVSAFSTPMPTLFQSVTSQTFGAEKPFDPLTDIVLESPNMGIRLDCVCGAFGNEEDMFRCSQCKVWGHLCCYGYSSSRDPRQPATSLCYKCLATHQATPDQVNSLFVSQSWSEFQQKRLLCRAVTAMWKKGSYQSAYALSKKFGLLRQKHKTEKIEDTLIKKGILKDPSPRVASLRKNGSRTSQEWRLQKEDPGIQKQFKDLLDPRHLLDWLNAALSRSRESQDLYLDIDSRSDDTARSSSDALTLGYGGTTPTLNTGDPSQASSHSILSILAQGETKPLDPVSDQYVLDSASTSNVVTRKRKRSSQKGTSRPKNRK